MHKERLVLETRRSLIIIDDRSRWCRYAETILTYGIKEAGCGKTLRVKTQIGLERSMFAMLREQFPTFDSRTGGLCVFPGRSAAKIRENAEWSDCYESSVFDCESFLSLHVERWFLVCDKVVVTAGELFPERPVCLNIRNIIVIDDVISTGATIREVCNRNRYKFPRAEWYAAACVSRVEKIAGYKEVFTPLLVPVDKYGLKVPINSLSTLLEDEPIARHYGEKHCAKPEIFLRVLEEIKSQYGGIEPEMADRHLVPWRDC